jgi:hypothetical protein
MKAVSKDMLNMEKRPANYSPIPKSQARSFQIILLHLNLLLPLAQNTCRRINESRHILAYIFPKCTTDI